MRMLSLSPHRTAPLTQHRKDKQYISPKGPWWPCSVYSLSYLLEEVLVGRSRDKQCSDNGKLGVIQLRAMNSSMKTKEGSTEDIFDDEGELEQGSRHFFSAQI